VCVRRAQRNPSKESKGINEMQLFYPISAGGYANPFYRNNKKKSCLLLFFFLRPVAI
jgi:hypothetical protein